MRACLWAHCFWPDLAGREMGPRALETVSGTVEREGEEEPEGQETGDKSPPARSSVQLGPSGGAKLDRVRATWSNLEKVGATWRKLDRVGGPLELGQSGASFEVAAVRESGARKEKWPIQLVHWSVKKFQLACHLSP